MKLKQIRVDGYKNLINCVVNLGDFNVIVGPNNSGKSNLLEALQILWPICFGDENLRKGALTGNVTPRFTLDSSICHLQTHKNKPLTIGITFETKFDRILWVVSYEVSIQCDGSENGKGAFISESLTAKIPSKPGPAREYISRQRKFLKIAGKEHKIASDNSSLLAINSLYPDFEGLPSELKPFIKIINLVSKTRILAISPTAIRRDIDQEKAIEGIKISSFDISFILDRIKEEGKYFTLFKESLCDILGLEDIIFDVQIKELLSEKTSKKEKAKRIRLFFVKRKGDDYSFIEEYSDGTLLVVSVLEALFFQEARGPILCLEELENCLHPAAVEKLLRFLQDHSDKWPVLITTHSPYLLNGVKPEDINVAVLDDTGATHFEKVKNSSQLRDYLNKNLLSFGELLSSDFHGFREG